MRPPEVPEVIVNGEARPLAGLPAHTNALDLLRGLGLTGAKEGCAEGECGACAVMVVRPDGDGSRWTPVNACLVPAAALDGQEVVTAEGLGTPDDLHPVQAELAVRGGSQCGYCTPGFVCSMAAEYYRPDRVSTPLDQRGGSREDDAEHGLYVLEGKAVYLLNQDWVEVQEGDFMWLRAFCPQACYAGGPGQFRYLLYKDVNRHVGLGRPFG